jgi:hypothetical protein
MLFSGCGCCSCIVFACGPVWGAGACQWPCCHAAWPARRIVTGCFHGSRCRPADSGLVHLCFPSRSYLDRIWLEAAHSRPTATDVCCPTGCQDPNMLQFTASSRSLHITHLRFPGHGTTGALSRKVGFLHWCYACVAHHSLCEIAPNA